MGMYPLVLPQKVKRSLGGLYVLCIRWWKRKVIRGMFQLIEYKYGNFNKTQEGSTLGGGFTYGRIRYYRRGQNGETTKLEIDLIDT